MPFYDEQRDPEFNSIYRVLALSAKVTLANVSGVPIWDLILRERNRKELNYNRRWTLRDLADKTTALQSRDSEQSLTLSLSIRK